MALKRSDGHNNVPTCIARSGWHNGQNTIHDVSRRLTLHKRIPPV